MLFRRLRMYRYWYCLLSAFVLTGCLDGSNSGNIYTKSDPDNAFSVGANGCPIPQLNKVTPTTTIDVLVLKTNDAEKNVANKNLDVAVAQAFSVANTTYAQSGVPLQFNHVGSITAYSPSNNSNPTPPYTYANNNYDPNDKMGETLEKLTNEIFDKASDTSTVRDNNKADIVVLIRQMNTSYNTCGIAWVPYGHDYNKAAPTKTMSSLGNYAVTVITLDDNRCGGPDGKTFAHELGHLLSLQHGNPDNDKSFTTGIPQYGRYSYSKGFAQQGVFGTTMVYAFEWDADCELPIFSNPDMAGCDPMLGCGIRNQIDAVSTIKDTMGQMSQIFP